MGLMFLGGYIAQWAELLHWRPPCSEASPLADGFDVFVEDESLRGLSSYIGTHPVARPAPWPMGLMFLWRINRSGG
ncbi:MAG: hypothetical protein CSA60_04385 [Neptuniibacter caesariensis]|uniref:Uncharacterized protein n=1 Tax=Neptuniibacter caesariensis TaxID=207954 RepID=A0A2G6JMA2_NEPCE|nr:MAG: hypothetical protein CSA60_04385 [Neptuniibacter caesariensis]